MPGGFLLGPNGLYDPGSAQVVSFGGPLCEGGVTPAFDGITSACGGGGGDGGGGGEGVDGTAGDYLESQGVFLWGEAYARMDQMKIGEQEIVDVYYTGRWYLNTETDQTAIWSRRDGLMLPLSYDLKLVTTVIVEKAEPTYPTWIPVARPKGWP